MTEHKTTTKIEPSIEQLIPHRSPMLLIHRIGHIDAQSASAYVNISQEIPFYLSEEGFHGVPAWIGLEYMGQTAALIAGQQLIRGELQSHLGILLGSRKYEAQVPIFYEGQTLLIECQQTAVVGDSLIKFQCTISCADTQKSLASGNLSVLRMANEQ